MIRKTLSYWYCDHPSLEDDEPRFARRALKQWLKENGIKIVETKKLEWPDREYVIEIPDNVDFATLLATKISKMEADDDKPYSDPGKLDERDVWPWLSWKIEIKEEQ